MRPNLTQRLLGDYLANRLGDAPRDVVDLGGGTGGLAVTLAGLGHRVTVIDPSPDALAALQRRAAEAGVADRLSARQGDTSTDLPPASADLVLCHEVLQFVDDRAAAAANIAAVLRPGGALSLVIEQRYPRAMTLAAAGDFAGAQRVGTDPALLAAGDADAFIAAAGLDIVDRHGLGIVAARIPDEVSEGRGDQVAELERLFAHDPGLLAAAPRLHLYAQ